ncbi:MAG: TIGR00282 family metallophosphoesterase [Halanaerobiales bacterium]
MKILFIGDIVGRAGRRAVRKLLPELGNEYKVDMVIANAENSAGGFGITEKVANELFGYGIDCLTMGNHTWNNKDIFNFIDDEKRLIRPLNYMPGVPGRGWTVMEIKDLKVGIINLIGQVFMAESNSPVMVYNQYISKISQMTDIIIIDFHAEATGEKLAFANYVDGEVSAVIGTHTHIQTADERVLPKGTGYITDLGLTGAVDSILGMKKEGVIEKYVTKLPQRFEVGTGQCKLEGAILEINEKNAKTEQINRIYRSD